MFKNTMGRQIALNAFVPVLIAMLLLEFITLMNTKRLIDERNKQETKQIENHIQEVGNNYAYIFQAGISRKKDTLKAILEDISPEIQKINVAGQGFQDLLKQQPQREHIHLFVTNPQGAVLQTAPENPIKDKLSIPAQVQEDDGLHFSELLLSPGKNQFGIAAFMPSKNRQYVIGAAYFPLFGDSLAGKFFKSMQEMKSLHPLVNDVHIFQGHQLLTSTDAQYVPDEKELERVTNALSQNKQMLTRKVNSKRTLKYFQLGNIPDSLLDNMLVALEFDCTHSAKSLRDEIYKYIALLVITLLGLVLILRNRVKSIEAPIKRITESVAKIKNDDYYERVKFVGNRELTGLVKEFNQLLDQLEEKNEKILSLKAAYEKIENQNKDIQENNFHVKDELKRSKTTNNFNTNYVLRLKENLLHSEQTLHKYVPEAFIFSRPKEVIGGDFYWFTRIDDTLIFIVGDSTGHGVPGGVISFFGLGLTEHIISKHQIKDPQIFLQYLDNEMNNLLYKGDNDFFFDGMDVAMCSFDIKTQVMKFSGAKRPVYIVRNQELYKLEGGQFPVGKFLENSKEFPAREMQMQENDKVYLFSDGFRVQTGDLNKKRYSEERFKNFLKEISNNSFKEQKRMLEKELEDWMGMEEQVDDIVVVGFNPLKYKRSSS